MSDEQQFDDTNSEEDAAMEAVKGPALSLVIFAVIVLWTTKTTFWQCVILTGRQPRLRDCGAGGSSQSRSDR